MRKRISDEPWFVGKDVATALGYKDTDQTIRKNVDEEDKLTRLIDGAGQKREAIIINESGLYSLILSSKLTHHVSIIKRMSRFTTPI